MPEPPTDSLAWVRGAAKVKKLALRVSLIVGITAISGAFVAGNDAGHAFNTFPKMGDTWIPDDIFDLKPVIHNFFENTSAVQLDHRILAITSLTSIGALCWFTRKLDIHPAVATVGMATLQVIVLIHGGSFHILYCCRYPWGYQPFYHMFVYHSELHVRPAL
ncbi:heme A synthase COX15 [Populus alba]|uniref:heme A synthase COX15 n=1 Tax=Populus alba TaxID=43335 RepID=UPI00158F1DDF|nr:cytochrome c oxidase assembly protein COX15-like [Populus alba]